MYVVRKNSNLILKQSNWFELAAAFISQNQS